MKSKKQLFVTVLFSLIILFALSLNISALDNLAIKYIEQFFHKTLRKPARWIDIIQNTSHICIFILCIIYFLSYFNFGIELSEKIKSRISEIKSQYCSKNTLIIFAFFSFFFFIAYYGIISANYFYADDIFRNYGGNRSWIGFSRYISEFASILIHNNLKLNDIAPLTYFISIIIATATIMVLSVALTDSIKIRYLFALSIIFIAPFYAENISYRFDSPYMAISLFFSAIPFIFYKDKQTFIFVSVMSLLLTSFSYQAALTLYILSVIFIFAKNIFEKKDYKENFSFVFTAIISFIVTLVIFKLFFMNNMSNNSDDYFSTNIKISALIPNAINYIKETFNLNGGLMIKLFFLLSIISLIFNIFISTKKNKFLAFLIAAAIIAGSYILSFGPYLIFERPVFASRAFMGFNTFFALLLLSNLAFFKDKKSKLSNILLFVTVYSCIVFQFAYGNCLKNQKDYEDFRARLILQDLSDQTDKSETYNITILGNIGLCQKSRIAAKNYTLIKKLISVRPSEGHIWNEELFSGYNFKCTDKKLSLTEQFSLVKQTYYHDIYRNNNNFIIILK